MKHINLDLAKKHLNIESDFSEDDDYILGLIDMAEAAVEKNVCEKLDDLIEKNGGCLPAPLYQAALLMVGHMYQNREVVGSKSTALPNSYQYLIDLYKNYNN